MPKITDRLPVLNGKEICFVFYLYGEFINQYLEEMFYAYRGLMRHTNLAEIGRIRIFADTKEYHRIHQRLANRGLGNIVKCIPINGASPNSGYIPCFFEKEVQECRYAFFMDTDMWFAREGEARIDFKALIKKWDTMSSNTIFGQRQDRAQPEHRASFMVQTRIAPLIQEVVQANLRENLRFMAGWFVGMRNQSYTAEKIKAEKQYIVNILSDEVFYTGLLHKYPGIEIYEVIPYEIILEHIKDVGRSPVFCLNVGTRQFRLPEYDQQRKNFLAML